MDGLLKFIEINAPFILTYKYLLVFLGAAIEGLNTMVLAGFLVSTGALKPLPTFILLVFGYTVNGYGWYAVGYFAGSKPLDRWGRKDEKGRKVIETVERYFHRYSGRAIVITKFTFSLTIATLIMAGSLKYNFKKFMFYDFVGSLGWAALTMGIGFFFGQSYQFFFKYIENVTYGIIFIALAIVLLYLLKISFKSRFVKSLQVAEKIKELGEKIKTGLDEWTK